MFTINIKGKRNPKCIDLVKLTMIFYRRDYPRITKCLAITELFKDWNNKTQSFKSKSTDSESKNRLLQQLKLKYLKIAERWEYQGKEWIPIELSHYYDKDTKSRDMYISVSEMINQTIDKFKQKERYKNGRIFTSKSTVTNYHYLKNALEKFTHSKYRREFLIYNFISVR